jgi:glyoxylase-like metal-dependent hydrolase (beta-lactamase superfamily II)
MDATKTLHWSDTDVEVHKVVVGPYDNNVFVVRCRHSGEAVLLDAANEHELLLDLASALGVRTILETHGHHDHIQAIPQVRDAGYEVGVTAADAAMLPSYDYILEDDQMIEFGTQKLHTVTTPGHTPGSICFKLVDKPLLFSGDTLFPGGPGKTSFDHGNFTTIIDSIDRRLFTYGTDTIVLPGHGDDTTVGAERPHLQEWVDRGW